MKRMRNGKAKRILAMFLSLTLLVGVLTIGQVTPVQAKQTVRVGFFESVFFHKNEAGKYSGYAYDYLQDIAAYADWNYEYVEGEWADLYAMLEKGEIDILADVSKLPEREGTILFPTESMGVERYYIYASSQEENALLEDYQELNGKRIGAIAGSFQENLLKTWAEEHGIKCQIVCYSGDMTMAEGLEKGEVDAVLGIDAMTTIANCVPVAEIGKSEIYFAVNKYRYDILRSLESAMTAIFSTNPNYNNTLYEKYLQMGLNSNLSTSELTWLQEHEKIRVGYRDNYLAFCGTDENGQLTGMLKDYLETGGNSFGNATLAFEPVPYKNTQAALDALAAGEIDCVFPVSIGKSDCESMGIYISSIVISTGNYAVVKDPKDIAKADVRVAVNGGNPNYISFLEHNFPTWTQVYYDTTEDCMRGIAKGEADCIIVANFRINNVESMMSRYGLTMAYLDTTLDMSFAVRRGEKDLYSILNKMIAVVPDDTISNSMLIYASDEAPITIATILKQNFWGAFAVLLAIIALISVLLVVSIRTANKARKTAAILAVNNEVLSSISVMYFGIYRIDLVHDFYEEITSQESLHRLSGNSGTASAKMKEIVETGVAEEYKEVVGAFFDLETLPDRMRDTDTIEREYHVVDGNWHQSRFIAKKRDENGRVTNVLFLTRQVSDMKSRENRFKQEILEAKAAAEAANEAKTTFLFNMSHDIRTPMNAIMGYSQLIKKNATNPTQVLYYQDRIEQSSDLLLSLINNVLNMARIESGQVEVDEEYDCAGDILTSILTVFESKMHEKSITLRRSVNVQHKHIMCDVTKVREVYSNLISNAIKYTPEGGMISVLTKEIPCDREGYVLIQTTIRDTGIGISEEFLPHIFDSFTRERNTTTSGVAGTGLGMAIVKHLTELMGGTIEVESKLGEGTRFIVTLPHKIAPAEYYQNKKEEQKEWDESMFFGKRILLAEDNELNAEIATTLLEEVGFAVERAEDGVICVDMLDKAAPGYYDIILMDIQMPNMDGYLATRTIRQMADEKKRSIPILAMTANAFEEDKHNAFEAGMNGHIAKPIDVALLMKTIQDFLT